MRNTKTVDRVELVAASGNMQEAIQDALLSAKEVILLSGIYETGPLEIPSSTTLIIKKDATLKFIPDFDLYTPVYSRWEGVKCWCMHPCLLIENATDARVVGEGTIDGSGEVWWKESIDKRSHKDGRPSLTIEKRLASMNPGFLSQPSGGGGRQTQFLRPPLIQILDSEFVYLKGITVTNSPFWTIHPLFSRFVNIENVHVKNPYDAPNTDGIDIESCSNVCVSDCIVDVGDDGIALKSGSGPDGIADGIPAKDITIRGCTVKAAHGGAVIGSETAGGIKNLLVEDCVFDGTDRGVRIKTRRGRGGDIANLHFVNITMKDNLCPFVINTYYKCGADSMEPFSLDSLPVTSETPTISSIKIEKCTATGCKSSAGMIVGLPEMPVDGLVIKDCSFEVAKDANRRVDESDMYWGLPTPESRGFRIRNAKGLVTENFNVICDGDKIIIEDGVEIRKDSGFFLP